MNNPYSLSLIMFFNKFLIIDDQRINAQTAIKKKRIGSKTMTNSLIFMYTTDINKIIIL